MRKDLQGCNVIKNETPPQASSSEYCEVFKNTYFKEHLRTVAAFVCLRVIGWLLFPKIDLYIWRKPNGLWNIPDDCPENCLAKTSHRDIIQNNFERIFANFLLLYPLKTCYFLTFSGGKAFVRSCSVKKMFLKFLQKSLESTCVGVAFLIKFFIIF